MNFTSEAAIDLDAAKITHRLCLDKQPFTRKPAGAEIGAIQNRLIYPDSRKTVTAAQLARAILAGRSFTPGYLEPTDAQFIEMQHHWDKDPPGTPAPYGHAVFWKSQSIFAADIDNAESYTGADGKKHKRCIDNPLTPARALDICREHAVPPFMIYYSFSSAEDWPRFRILWQTPEPVTNGERAEEYSSALCSIFEPYADTGTADRARLLFGGKGLYFSDYSAAVPLGNLDALPAMQRPQRSGRPPTTYPRQVYSGGTYGGIIGNVEELDRLFTYLDKKYDYKVMIIIAAAANRAGYPEDHFVDWAWRNGENTPESRAKYNPEELARIYRSCSRPITPKPGKQPVTPQLLIDWAIERGYTPPAVDTWARRKMRKAAAEAYLDRILNDEEI